MLNLEIRLIWMMIDLCAFCMLHYKNNHANPLSFMTYNIILPIYAGDLTTLIPAFSKALIFSGALPLPSNF